MFEEWPVYGSLQPMGPVFAVIRWVELPNPGWHVTLQHRGWDRRLAADFRSIEHAKRSVERWTAAHWQAVETALKASNGP